MARPKKEHIVPEWVNHPALNKSYLCEMLNGSKEKSITGYFTKQRQGKVPFSAAELEALDKIRSAIIKGL